MPLDIAAENLLTCFGEQARSLVGAEVHHICTCAQCVSVTFAQCGSVTFAQCVSVTFAQCIKPHRRGDLQDTSWRPYHVHLNHLVNQMRPTSMVHVCIIMLQCYLLASMLRRVHNGQPNCCSPDLLKLCLLMRQIERTVVLDGICKHSRNKACNVIR